MNTMDAIRQKQLKRQNLWHNFVNLGSEEAQYLCFGSQDEKNVGSTGSFLSIEVINGSYQAFGLILPTMRKQKTAAKIEDYTLDHAEFGHPVPYLPMG